MDQIRVKNAEIAAVLYASGFCNGLMQGSGLNASAEVIQRLVATFAKDFAMEFSLDDSLSLSDYFETWIVGRTEALYGEMLGNQNE